MSFDLTNKNISDTFQNLLQKTGSQGRLYDLKGNLVDNLTIGGTLTAHSYVTSESIVNTSSGSTADKNDFLAITTPGEPGAYVLCPEKTKASIFLFLFLKPLI